MINDYPCLGNIELDYSPCDYCEKEAECLSRWLDKQEPKFEVLRALFNNVRFIW